MAEQQPLAALRTAWFNYDQYDSSDHPENRHQAWLKLREALQKCFGSAASPLPKQEAS